MNWIFSVLETLWEAIGVLFSWSVFLLSVMFVIELILIGKESDK